MSDDNGITPRTAELPADAAPTNDLRIGDAVEVAQWPCCGYKIGQKFRIRAMERPPSGFMRCVHCGVRHETTMDALGPYADWNPVAWLKRIEDGPNIPNGTRLG